MKRVDNRFRRDLRVRSFKLKIIKSLDPLVKPAVVVAFIGVIRQVIEMMPDPEDRATLEARLQAFEAEQSINFP
jgi:hypothetical protein